MQDYLLGKYQRGEIKPPDNEGTRADAENRRDNRQRTPPRREPTYAEHEIKKRKPHEDEVPKKGTPRGMTRRQPPPSAAKTNQHNHERSPQASRIDVTTEGSRAARDNTTNSRIKHLPVTFNNQDTTGLDAPHKDPLVITLTIADCEVSRILVDTGSSVEIIFKDTLRKMNVDESSIKPKRNP